MTGDSQAVGDAPAAPTPATAASIEEAFGDHLEEAVQTPLIEALERYGASLRAIVEKFDRLDRGDPYEYADRFVTAFRADILDPADRDRAELFGLMDPPPPADEGALPEAVTAGPADPGSGTPDALVRPGPGKRLMVRLRSRDRRTVPVGALARVYMAELARRLEAAASRAGSLDSVALADIRRRLGERAAPATEPPTPAEGHPELESALDETRQAILAAIDSVRDGFARAVRAPAVSVERVEPGELRERAAARRGRLLREWQSFEEALHANTFSEAALARALAAMDATTARAVRDLDHALDTHAREPLQRVADGLEELAGHVQNRLRGDSAIDVIGSLRTETERLFEAELPHLTRELPAALAEVAASFVDDLEGIPATVPDDLRISERPIRSVPDRPVELELRDAPLTELLEAACRGALPRWLERTLATTSDEIEALGRELRRVSKAVDFHIRAPLRGDFVVDEAMELVTGGMERARSQVEDLRETGLDPLERVLVEVERRSGDEADAVRAAVADREFLRMRSEIAEERAARQLTSGVTWARRLVDTSLRLARLGWSAGRRTFDRTQDWAERQLGVADVEREEMLETLEASLLGEDPLQAALPGLYRQLFDVEGEVPWEELLVGRDRELATIERALGRWRRGQSASVAVIGEKGSGKTTLLRMAAELFGDAPVTRVELPGTSRGPDDLARHIAAGTGVDLDAIAGEGDASVAPMESLTAALRGEDRAVVVVEDAHRMFVRALGGFAAMEAFLELVAATRRHVLWIITIDRFAWRYLDAVLGLAPHFTHVVRTTTLSPEKVEEAVMARHDVSGFGLRFELDEEVSRAPGWWRRLRAGRETTGELSRRELDRRRFFRELNQLAEGNIFLALFYWIRAVERVDDHVLVIRSPDTIELEFLERLPLPSLHTIAAIILHGGLSEDEHRRIFHLGDAESRLQLAALADAHLIFRSHDDEYKLNKVLYRPLIRLLETKNIF